MARRRARRRSFPGFPTALYDNGAGDIPSRPGIVIVRTQYLTSPDGIAWTEHGTNPILREGLGAAWDNGWVESPSVVKYGSTFYMWYTGGNTSGVYRIGLATSSDGITWMKHPGNPVFGPNPAASWEDGVTWTRFLSNPVLDLGVSGAWDENGCFVPTVVLSGGTYRMWYLSGDNPNEKDGLATWTP